MSQHLYLLSLKHPLPTAAQWAEALQLKRNGPNNYSGPCPLCGGTDRFHVTQRQQRTLVGCRGCIDTEPPAVRAARFGDLIETFFPQSSTRKQRQGHTRVAPRATLPPAFKQHRTTANTPPPAKSILPALLFDRAKPLFPSPGADYLIERKLHPQHLPVDDFQDIRWLPARRAPRHVRGWPGLPDQAAGAIIVAYRLYEHLKAVNIEAITADGQRVTPNRWRRVFGQPNQSVFLLTKQPGLPLVITEGYTSALAAYWLYPHHNALSIGSATNAKHVIDNFSARFDNKHIIIDMDGDTAGHTATWQCHKALTEQRIHPLLLLRHADDAADELQRLLTDTDNRSIQT